jgi:hypothetical protein
MIDAYDSWIPTSKWVYLLAGDGTSGPTGRSAERGLQEHDREVDMGIGAGLFLIALGAIFAFAVNVQLSGIDLNVVGWILMVIGIVGILLTVLYFRPRTRRQALVRERVYTDDPNQPPV